MSLSQDVLVSIVRELPIKEQLTTALELLDKEHTVEFVKKAKYIRSLDAELQKDVKEFMTPFVQKHGMQYESKWKAKCDIEIKNFDVAVPDQPIHKIEVWQDMYKRGLVGPYHLSVTNQVCDSEDKEEIRVTLDIRSISADDVMITLDARGHDYNLNTIVAGTRRTTRKIEKIFIMPIYLTEGRTCFVRPRNSENEYEATFTIGIDKIVVRYSNPPSCEFSKYKFGVDDDLIDLLY